MRSARATTEQKQRNTKTGRRNTYRKLREQKIMGLLMLACAALAFLVCCTGRNVMERDSTAAFLAAALGFWLLCTKKIIIY